MLWVGPRLLLPFAEKTELAAEIFVHVKAAATAGLQHSLALMSSGLPEVDHVVQRRAFLEPCDATAFAVVLKIVLLQRFEAEFWLRRLSVFPLSIPPSVSCLHPKSTGQLS